MRILHTIRTVDPAGGGVVEALKQIAASTSPLGLNHEIVSLDQPHDDWVLKAPLPVYALTGGREAFGYSRNFSSWLREHSRLYDAVVVHGLWQYHALGTHRAMAGSRVPYYVYPHGMLDPWFKRSYPLKHLKKLLYWPWADYRTIRDARAVLFTCEEERRLARESFRLYRANEIVVGLGTTGILGDSNAQKEVFFTTFPHLREKRIFLFLGRVHVKKGPDLLLRAFAALLAELPRDQTEDLHLVMAGPNDHLYGHELKYLADTLGLSADRITWTGMVQGDLKAGVFRAAEVFVLPSHQENFGIAVVEALSAGVPVLLGKGVNIWPEIVRDGAGIAEPDTLQGTLTALRHWVLKSRAERLQMSDNAKTCFDVRFHISLCARRFVDVVNGAISH